MSLPEAVLAWIADATGGRVTSARRVPGGATREAWFVDVTDGAGEEHPLFVRYDRTPRPPGGLFHPLRVEAEVLIALHGTDVTVPRTLAVHPTEEAALSERVDGETWFYRIADPEEQVRVARDFIRNLAALHRLDPRELDLPSLGPVRTPAEHALEEIASMRRRATAGDGAIDPMLRFALDWLERNVPDYEGPTVLVQGDTGPGNFMYADGRVTAVVDWELAHFGDPMDDIAWLSLRTVQDTFTHFPDRLTEYEELSGHKIDETRVWYYRLFAEVRLATARPTAGVDRAAEAIAAYRDIGNGLIYSMLHRRLLIEALAHNVGIDLPAFDPPDAPASSHTYLYDASLAGLKEAVGRIDDPLAAQSVKGIARVLKYLKEIDRAGSQLALTPLPDHPTDHEYVAHLWREVQRDDYLMREASGALAERTWPPLS